MITKPELGKKIKIKNSVENNKHIWGGWTTVQGNIFQNCGRMSKAAGRYVHSIHLFDLFGSQALKVKFDLLGCTWPERLGCALVNKERRKILK